jgi:hypothetical protein
VILTWRINNDGEIALNCAYISDFRPIEVRYTMQPVQQKKFLNMLAAFVCTVDIFTFLFALRYSNYQRHKLSDTKHQMTNLSDIKLNK